MSGYLGKRNQAVVVLALAVMAMVLGGCTSASRGTANRMNDLADIFRFVGKQVTAGFGAFEHQFRRNGWSRKVPGCF